MSETYLNRKIREQSKLEKKFGDPIDRPFLSTREAAARLAISYRTLVKWVQQGVIPKPRKWGRFSNKTKPFKLEYVEALRDCLIIRNSTVGYRSPEDFRKLGWKRLFCLR